MLEYRKLIILLDTVEQDGYSRRVNHESKLTADGEQSGKAATPRGAGRASRSTPKGGDTETEEHGRDARVTINRGRGLQNMPFYQTNPPFFDEFFGVTGYAIGICDGKFLENSVGSFSKTNPPGGYFESLTGKNPAVLGIFGACCSSRNPLDLVRRSESFRSGGFLEKMNDTRLTEARLHRARLQPEKSFGQQALGSHPFRLPDIRKMVMINF